MTSPPLAVLWDMDGTLADSEGLHKRTLAAVLASLGAPCDAAIEAATLGKTEREVHGICSQRYGFTIGFEAWALARSNSYLRLVEHLTARDGALEVFHALRERGIPQAIVSNATRTVLDANLRALGLHDPALIGISIDDVHRGKPDPGPYLRAARLLGVPPAGAWVIEDSPIGAAAGLAAGMPVLAWPETASAASAFPAGVRLIGSAEQLALALGITPPMVCKTA